MADIITCPVCDETEGSATQIESFAICGSCGATLVIEDGIARRATGTETIALDSATLAALRKARGKVARPERRQR